MYLKPLVIGSWLTLLNECNTLFPISVSYNVYPKPNGSIKKATFY